MQIIPRKIIQIEASCISLFDISIPSLIEVAIVSIVANNIFNIRKILLSPTDTQVM